MKTNRRRFLTGLGAICGVSPLVSMGQAAESLKSSVPQSKASMKLGMVTYQLGQDWDLPTIIKNCEAAQFDGVELRTSHKHGVEVTLSAEERDQVRQRFQDSKVELMGLGSAFDYHTPDAQKLRRDIDAT